MRTTAEKDAPCDACGGVVPAGTQLTWQPGPPGLPVRVTHRVCPGAVVARVPVQVATAVWDALDAVELSGFPPDDPIPLLLTKHGEAVLAWS